jgi:RNA polymerase sigma-70 factor, ECF subfamily
VKDRAFQLIFEEHNRMVAAYLHSMLGDWHEAADLTQETFVVAYGKMREFEADRSLAAWLRGIARNLARNALRARKKRLALLDHESVERLYAKMDALPGDTPWEERLEPLDECLAKLPERQRQSVDMHYGQDLTGRQIAERLGVKVKTAFQMLWQAREALRACIEQWLDHARAQTDAARSPSSRLAPEQTNLPAARTP